MITRKNNKKHYINCNILIPSDRDTEFYFEYKRNKIILCTENISLNPDVILYVSSPVKTEIYLLQLGTSSVYTTTTKPMFRIKLVNSTVLFLLEEEYHKFKEIING